MCDFCINTGNCGGVIDLTSGSQFIQSPGYNSMTPYDIHLECNWLIKVIKKVNNNNKISLQQL